MYDDLIKRLTFNADGHVPAIIQDAASKKVLTLCYMNEAALKKTIEAGYVYVYRRSLGKLMMKGETSGHTQAVKALALDCEGKSLLIEIEQKVAGCHKGYFSCYFEQYDPKKKFTVNDKKVFDPSKVY